MAKKQSAAIEQNPYLFGSKGEHFSQKFLVRRELQITRVLKYAPSIKNELLKHKFEQESGVFLKNGGFLDKLFGKPIEICNFKGLYVKKKQKPEEKQKYFSDKTTNRYFSEDSKRKKEAGLPSIFKENSKNANTFHVSKKKTLVLPKNPKKTLTIHTETESSAQKAPKIVYKTPQESFFLPIFSPKGFEDQKEHSDLDLEEYLKTHGDK